MYISIYVLTIDYYHELHTITIKLVYYILRIDYWLVGGFNSSQKYESIGMIIPNIWKNKKCSKPPTRLTIDY